MVDLFANSGDPDQTPRYAASDLGLHCLPVTCLRGGGLQFSMLMLCGGNLKQLPYLIIV